MATVAEAYEAAIAHHQSGCLDEAAILYRRILDADPDQAHASHLLGVVAAQQNRIAEAITLISAAVARDGRNPTFLSNLGAALKAAGRYDEAISHLVRTLELDPAAADALANLGAALAAEGRFDDAVRWLKRAVALAPARFEACLNLGVALRDRGRFDEALAAFESARSLRPDDPHLACETAVLHLADGDLARGWALYENRWRFVGHTPSVLGRPQWLGEDIRGKSILVYFEQGLGDTLQFVRYVPMLAERGARVTLVVQPSLKRLVASVRGLSSLITFDDPIPPTDLCSPLMSLPHAFGTRLDSIPAGGAYLAPDPDLVAQWAQRLGPRRLPRVGLVWSGAPRRHDPKSYAFDRRRSLPFSAMAPLLDVPGIEFVSLQMGDAADQARAAVAAGRLADPMAAVTDFADTAAIAANLDLVVSVDTSALHAAAAIGRPVWGLSRFDGCWRWLRDRDDSPWYPTLRLYRQEQPGAWEPVLARIAQDLQSGRFVRSA